MIFFGKRQDLSILQNSGTYQFLVNVNILTDQDLLLSQAIGRVNAVRKRVRMILRIFSHPMFMTFCSNSLFLPLVFLPATHGYG